MNRWCSVLVLAAVASLPATARKKPKVVETPLDRYVREATGRPATEAAPSPGSLWSPSALMTDLARDPRAGMVDDIVTIVVAERASAVATGGTKSARTSSAKSGVNALGGVTRTTGPLAKLADLSTDTKLDGQGSTSRQTVLTTTLSARIVAVLPNGNLVVEGAKQIQVNSEDQTVMVRGVIRPADVTRNNTIASERLAQLQVVLNGKGVVGDAVRRPSFLYRLLLGLLPF